MKESILKKILLVGVVIFIAFIAYLDKAYSSTNFTTSINNPEFEKVLKLLEDQYLPIYPILKNEKYRYKVSKSIYLASKKYNVRYDLIASIIDQESDFKLPKDGKHKGLMQVNPRHWKFDADYNLLSVHGSIMAGAFALNETSKLCNQNLECTIKSYNSGYYKYSNSKKKHLISRKYYKDVKSRLLK
ncbi:lytic murein transglycosylase [Yersinia phage YerA41]|nr:lytic murein transglycosylase [Yersinia phage YerA41]